MSTCWPFCRMKMSRNSRTTPKNATANHRPLILVCRILCCGGGSSGGSGAAADLWVLDCGSVFTATPIAYMGSYCPSGPGLCAGSALQVGEHGQHAPVVVVGGLQVELEEDGCGVLGHGAFGDDQALGDGDVGPTLGHQGEDLALARAERTDADVAGVTGEQPGDHLRIHGRAAARDPADSVHELGAV